jgi:MarR family transcriptional regulator, transcriptional regulator for hemolysin
MEPVATKLRAPSEDSAPAVATECLSNNLGWLLDRAENVLASELALALEPLGLSSRRYCVLATALGQDRTQIELANLIGLDKTTMVATVDALEEAGLAERRPSSQDRRVRVIAVTKAGGKKVAEARKLIEQVQADVLARLPAREREALLSGLSRLVAEGPAKLDR